MGKDINPNSRSPFVDQDGKLSKYGMDVILKIYRTLEFSGENSSLLDDLLSQGIAIARSEDSVQDYIDVTTTSNFTTHTNSFINVTAQCTIILNPYPEDKEQVIIHKNTGLKSDYVAVTDGAGTDRLVIDQTVISYRYSIELNQWVRGG